MASSINLTLAGIYTPDTGATTSDLVNINLSTGDVAAVECGRNSFSLASSGTNTVTPDNVAAGDIYYIVKAAYATAEPAATRTFTVNTDGLGALPCHYLAAGGCATAIVIANTAANATRFEVIFYQI